MSSVSRDAMAHAAEAKLRAALEPSAAEVERAVAAALAPRRRSRARAWSLALAGGATLLLAGLLAPGLRQAEPAPRAGQAIVSVGSLLLVAGPGRQPWVGNAAPPDARQSTTPSLLVLWQETAP